MSFLQHILSFFQSLHESLKQNEELKARLIKSGDMLVTDNVVEGFSKVSFPVSPSMERVRCILSTAVSLEWFERLIENKEFCQMLTCLLYILQSFSSQIIRLVDILLFLIFY